MFIWTYIMRYKYIHEIFHEINFTYGKEQFLTEAKTLAAFIGDEHIVRIYSFFEENNTAYIVMEFLDGVDLNKHIHNNGIIGKKYLPWMPSTTVCLPWVHPKYIAAITPNVSIVIIIINIIVSFLLNTYCLFSLSFS